jgi:hypothetical protein
MENKSSFSELSPKWGTPISRPICYLTCSSFMVSQLVPLNVSRIFLAQKYS